ncbi:SRPBCC family protein [Nocardia sp. NPDC049190]|uniref:SRPBCC family protein n=1 Tax=Nocardia sp. NPDC049190 TaxID=3155650 RepID=UPI0033F5A75A
MPRSYVMHFETTIDIDASPETVWRILVDIETWPEWTESIRSVRRLDSGEFTIGSRAEVRQPRLLTAIWTVTELIPGRSFTWRATSPGVTTTAGHELIDRADSVTVRLVIDQTGSLGWLFGWATAHLTRRYLEWESHGLKQRAESG